MYHAALFFLIGIVLFCVSPQVHGHSTSSEVLALSSVLELGNNLMPTDGEPLRMGIVYDPQNPHSVHDKNEVMTYLPLTHETGGLAIDGVAIPIDSLELSIPQYRILFITEGVEHLVKPMLYQIIQHRVLTVSTYVDCVRARVCALGVRERRTVDVFIARKLLTSLKIKFDITLMMLARTF